MSTAVVPSEMSRWEIEGNGVVQHTVQVINNRFRIIHLIDIEEVGGWHLFRVTNHDERLASGNGSDCFAGGHL